MKTPSSPALLGFILLVLAGVFAVSTRRGPASDSDDSQPGTGHLQPERATQAATPVGSGATIKQPQEEKPPLLLTEEGIADFSNYDRNGDGDPEVDAFLEVYQRLDSSAGKVDMLDNVRTFDTLDEPRLNDLLIDQAAKAEDSEVRRAARSALFEHGGAKAHESLAAYLKSETRAADRHELEKLLEDLQRTPLRLARANSKMRPTSPSPPSTNN